MSSIAHVALLGAAACAAPAQDAPRAGAPLTGPALAARAAALGVTPIALDARGAPRLVRGAGMPTVTAAGPAASARAYVERLAPAWGVSTVALPVLASAGDVPVRAGTIVRLRQVIDGLPVERGELRVLVGRSGELVAASGTLVGTDTPRARPRWVDDDAGAIARAVRHAYAGAFPPETLAVRRLRGDGARMMAGRAGAVAVELAAAHQAWIATGQALEAAWVVEAYARAGDGAPEDAFRTVIAADGRVLSHRSLIADAAFGYRVFADPGDGQLRDGPIPRAAPHATGAPDGSYPPYAPPELVSIVGLNHPAGAAGPDPWLPPDATETVGNNVDAYADASDPTGLTDGDFRATLTAPGVFDRSYDTGLDPLASPAQQMAAITSLFYAINWLHDFWYDAGFTEVAGNAQTLNYGRGGVEGDAMLAEAQDGALRGARNNANMATMSDGMPPRMQIYLWTGNDHRTLELLPSGRTPAIGVAAFGPRTFDVTGGVALALDGAGANPGDACTPLTAAVTGAVVLADRGNCTYETKALHVQEAGGVGLLVANHLDDPTPPAMGDDGTLTTPVTIGVASITRSEGELIKAEVAAGAVTARLARAAEPDLDGALDTTLIAHELGHYIHHRLSACDTQMCGALSEGWADFIALLVTVRAGSDLTGAYPITVYAAQTLSQDPAYFGIRRAPYSVDPAINALSFRHMAEGEPPPATHPWEDNGSNAEVHNAGEVWAAALWEGYVALQQAGGSFEEVRATMARYVVAGLLLAPPDASPTETRDALLVAALAERPADHDVLVAAFARRGLGSCAIAPAASSFDFVGLVESTATGGNVQPGLFTLADAVTPCDGDDVLDAGETARLRIPIVNRGPAPVIGATLTLSSPTPGLVVDAAPMTLPEIAPYSTTTIEADVTLDAAVATALAGELEVAIAAPGACGDGEVTRLPMRLNVDDVDDAAATDAFDTAASVWTPSSALVWGHGWTTAIDGLWRGVDLGGRSDTSLASPPLRAAPDAPLRVTVRHRHAFEHSNGRAFDGGVIELTTDGLVWQDISTWAEPGYGGTLEASSDNPLGGRAAFTGQSAGYPALTTTTLELGSALAGQTFKLRFRIGTDQAVGAPGWEIDEVAFEGLDGTPFPVLQADDGVCGAGPDAGGEDPWTAGGGGCCDAGPVEPGAGVLALGVLGLATRRRRARVNVRRIF